MIITRTPFRMSFFGGGTDFFEFYNKYGGSVISTTFDKYCYISTRHLPRFFDYSNHLSYDADLPARSGLGTSSSFAVGMINSFHVLKGEHASKKELADEAIHVERVLCNEAGGIQDQIAASFGGFNRINFNSDGYYVNPIIMSPARKQELNRNLLLFFTGISRYSFQIQISMKEKIKDKEKDLKEMLLLVDEAESILTSQKSLDEFGKLLDYTWKLKRGISSNVSTESIDSLYKKAISAGALGGKILGAGGGGFLLFYVQPEKRNSVLAELQNLIHIPFQFETEGTKVIYYEHESWDQNQLMLKNSGEK